MKLLIHIGAWKTGTTSLQRSLAKGNNKLDEKGILYPEAGRRFGKKLVDRHVGLRFSCEDWEKPANGMMKQLGLSSPEDRKSYSENFWHTLKDEIGQTNESYTTIMSDEALFIFSNKEMIERLSKNARKIFSRMEVVAWIRRPSDYLASEYSQSIKMGSRLTWEEFMEKRLSSEQPCSIFEEKLSVWRTNIRADRFTVRVMNGNILEQFAEEVQMEESLEKFPSGNNSSLSMTGIKVLRKINEFSGGAKHRPHKIRQSFEEFATGEKWKPSSLDLKRIDRAYKPEMLRIASSFTLSKPEKDIVESWFSKNTFFGVNSTREKAATSLEDEAIEEMANIILDLAKSKK